MDQVSTPRVNCGLLNAYVGRNVMVIGKVQLRGDVALIDADGNITAALNRDSHLLVGNAAQLIGKVNPDLSIKVLTSTDLGSNVDMNLCRSVVEVAQKLKPVFEFESSHH
ncbi:hypothetical protein MAPG_11630 [Magnaporthiopsis poae ATCC 64411]|uniref:Replication factor A protein 3 n=1 Tax=Magnaporthiopsis poae (strain ATCC 64411 / 73-15) TaxID=644358 RepID=A0A0C4EFS4_MAGP6|nr:hypothetical protein MAPG_11630 [Magnaporthiopsis poae ATCC 64411]